MSRPLVSGGGAVWCSGLVTRRCFRVWWWISGLVKIAACTLHRLSITRPEGGEPVVYAPPGNVGKEAFGWFGDMEPYGGVLVAGVPRDFAHTVPLVNGGDGIAGLAD